MAMMFGWLGRGFSRLGASSGKGKTSGGSISYIATFLSHGQY